MKLLKFINVLLAVLAIGVLSFFVVGDYFSNLSRTVFKVFVDPQEVYAAPSQGKSQGDIRLDNYNPNFALEYSTDGGKSYEDYSDESIPSLHYTDLTKYITSIRYKHPFGELPQVYSLLVKGKHRNKDFYLAPHALTFFENYHSTLPVISLIINEDDLFDPLIGIMVLGKHSWQDKGFYQKFWDRNANYKQRGGSWNKKAYFQYFEGGELKNQLICSAAISGNATRSFEQKSIKLKLNRAFSSEKFAYPFFGKKGLKKYNSLVIRNSGNDNKKTLFADLLMQSLAIDKKVLTQRGSPTNVFINGNYWGIYNLRERYDIYFIAKKEKVKEGEVTLLEGAHGELKDGSEEVQKSYIHLIDSIYNLRKITNQTVDEIGKKINLKSLENYVFNETFFGNGDWLNNNAMWYKAKNKKWKWLLNDLDYGLAYTGSENVNKNYFKVIDQSPTITAKLYQTLMRNKKFKKEFKKRLKKNIEKMYSKERIEKKYNALKNQLEPDMAWQLNRWRGTLTREKWEKNCANNLQFLLDRRAVYLQQIEEL